ncbi:unnamed protein product [Chondrus crispus]|uniref:Uncharacterized protein n=1 Tax=Chondrus crispus TaxID=2769 RepID=R7QEW6_CHOCR|nr:unnamed protein product [Chondrus crispus]CDF36328.1 unnamed protein product [Chondrus crispus]|eukprot:XP_005716147.1 unnamed protein product [Chondrus crispus]
MIKKSESPYHCNNSAKSASSKSKFPLLFGSIFYVPPYNRNKMHLSPTVSIQYHVSPPDTERF